MVLTIMGSQFIPKLPVLSPQSLLATSKGGREGGEGREGGSGGEGAVVAGGEGCDDGRCGSQGEA